MIWLTWRQFRASALSAFGVLGAVAAALALTGPRLYRDYADLLARCEHGCNGDVYDHFFFPRVGAYSGLTLLVIAVPALVGVFWGAPLISREFEAGTQELVWQQSLPRRRWLAAKVGIVGLAAIAAAGLPVVPVNWWSRPLDATAITGLNRMSPVVFDARGYAVLGHTAFAFILGVAAGLLIRRTVPAMAVTFAIFVAIQIVMPAMVRPHLATPVRLEAVITARNLTASTPPARAEPYANSSWTPGHPMRGSSPTKPWTPPGVPPANCPRGSRTARRRRNPPEKSSNSSASNGSPPPATGRP